jgi:hypothetical protein
MSTKQPLSIETLIGGRLLQDMNAELAEAQQEAFIRKQPAQITIKLQIVPPAEDEFGAFRYHIDRKVKRQPSRAFTTEVNQDGMICFDGTSPVDVKQIPMGLTVDETPIETPNNGMVFAFQRASN